MMARRPSKYTPERVARILQAIRIGATYRAAADYAGISHETLYEWMRTNLTFLTQVKEAEGAATVGWLAKIEQAASDGAWQAAAWKLERRYPQEYGRRAIEVSGPNGAPVPVRLDVGGFLDAVAAAEASATAAPDAGGDPAPDVPDAG